jgi:hypothetical protein
LGYFLKNWVTLTLTNTSAYHVSPSATKKNGFYKNCRQNKKSSNFSYDRPRSFKKSLDLPDGNNDTDDEVTTR